MTRMDKMTEHCMSPLFCCALRTSAVLTCVTGAVTRDGQNSATLFTNNGHFIKLCTSSAPSSNAPVILLGEPKLIRLREPGHLVPTFHPGVIYACWDAYSGSVYGLTDRAVVRVSEEGEATLVAGHPTQGGSDDSAGLSARFHECLSITSDGEGCLYVADAGQLRRLQLPAAWRSDGAAVTDAGPQGSSEQQQQQQQQGQGGQGAAGPGPAAEQVQVATVELPLHVQRVAYDPASRSLVLCSETAVYRLPVEGLKGAAAEAVLGTVHEPVHLAGSGREGYEGGVHRDGVGAEAVLSNIVAVAVDGTGAAWVLDDWFRGSGNPDGSDSTDGSDDDWSDYALVRRVDPSGRVATVPGGPLCWHKHRYDRIAVLGSGFLVLVSLYTPNVLLLHTGCAAPSPTPIAPAPGTLSSDLGELLDRQPDGSADVEVEVGGQVFAAHRGVLAARSPYFRQRLDPGAGFADGRAPRLSLPDADPAAFGAVLRFMYTDSAGPVPPELLQPVGELADRLLLPGLCAQVGSQLLGRVCAESVVGLLLWAEQRSGSFGTLLGGLKEWVLDNTGAESGRFLPEEEAARLMRESQTLALQLLYYRRGDGREHKRRRQE